MTVRIMAPVALALLLGLPRAAEGQQLDPKGDEDTRNSGIRISVNGEDRPQFVVLDSKWRWLYNSKNHDCGSGVLGAEKMERCYLQGLSSDSYKDSYGVHVGAPSNRGITLRYAAQGKDAPDPNYGVRVYLTDGHGYTLFRPLGGKVSFDVDVSKVPAGMNAAVYLVSMDRLGHLDNINPSGVINTAGWKRGVGYCDAQCPRDMKFVQGSGYNSGNLASCCPEMDLFEANRFTTAMTPHPCKLTAESVCDSDNDPDCKAGCDSDGADVNPFREKGPGHALFELLDTSQPFKVTTLFKTDNNQSDGTLVEIEQIFSQVLQDGTKKNFTMSLTDESAAMTKNIFRSKNHFGEEYGGLKQMGEALNAGMVMVLAIWSDPGGNMNWLDSCDANATEYDCAAHSKFDATVWAEASKVAPGAWRGPADYYKDFATSYKTSPVTFNYANVPPAFRTQAPFDCIGCNDYGFSVSNFETSQTDDPVTDDPAGPGASEKGGIKAWHWILVAVGVVVVIAGLIACCTNCSEDDVENMGRSKGRAKAKNAQFLKCGEESGSSSDSS